MRRSRQVLQDFPEDDRVEGRRLERHRQCIRDLKPDAVPHLWRLVPERLPCDGDGGFVRIDADDVRSLTRQENAGDSLAAADIEDVLSGGAPAQPVDAIPACRLRLGAADASMVAIQNSIILRHGVAPGVSALPPAVRSFVSDMGSPCASDPAFTASWTRRLGRQPPSLDGESAREASPSC